MTNEKSTYKARIGTLKNRVQIFIPEKGLLVKRDSKTGLVIENGGGNNIFKGVRKESLEKMAITLNKLARYDKNK